LKKVIVFYGLLLSLCLAVNGHANFVTNPGFETGDLSGWNPSGSVNVYTLPQVVHSGTYGAYLDTVVVPPPGTNDSMTQNVYLAGPGQYLFGGWLRYFTYDPAGNFDQGQISIYLNQQSGVVGSDPNGTQPFVDAGSGFVPNWKMSQNWFYFEGIYNYSGPAGFALLNINLQNQYSTVPTGLAVDDVFVNSVPEPTTLLFLGTGILGLVGLRRKFRK
jgi:hypothetical protein